MRISVLVGLYSLSYSSPALVGNTIIADCDQVTTTSECSEPSTTTTKQTTTKVSPTTKSTSTIHSTTLQEVTETVTKTTSQEPTQTSTADFFYLLENVHSRYAYAPYCPSVSEYYAWNCKDICEHEANATKLDFVRVDPVHDQVIQISHNPQLKSIYIGFRGSETGTNLQTDLHMKLSNLDWNNDEVALRPKNIPTAAKIHAGFEIVYRDQRLIIMSELHKISLEYPDYPIYFTGHSLGGALAIIAAVDFFDTYGMQDRINVITYGQPKTGDKTWCNYIESLPFSSRYFRVLKLGDPIPHLPSKILGYADCGNLVEYDEKDVPRICEEGEVESCKSKNRKIEPDAHSFYQQWIGDC